MLEASIKNSGGYNRHVVVASLLLHHVVVAPLLSSHLIKWRDVLWYSVGCILDNTCLPMITTGAA